MGGCNSRTGSLKYTIFTDVFIYLSEKYVFVVGTCQEMMIKTVIRVGPEMNNELRRRSSVITYYTGLLN
jgi:hypothetical protein